MFVQDWRRIEHADEIFYCLHCRGAIVYFGDDAGQALLAEGDQDAPSRHGQHALRDAIGEDGIERDGQGYIAIFRGDKCRHNGILASDAEADKRAPGDEIAPDVEHATKNMLMFW